MNLQSKKFYNKFFYEKLISYRVHFGCLKFFWNSRLKAYFLGARKNFLIFDLNKSLLSLRAACLFLSKIHLSGRKILFVGFPRGAEKEFALLCKANNHYVFESWPHGFFQRLKKHSNTSLKPAVLFVFSPSISKLAVQEANQFDIPVVGFVNANDSILGIDFPIFANINSLKAGVFVYNLFRQLFATKNIEALYAKLQLRFSS